MYNILISGMVPQFLEEPESMAVAPQSSVTLPCKVRDPKSTVVRWKFNGDFVKENDAKKFQINGTDLYIENFKHRRRVESNEGIYQCIARNEAGSLASKPARLSKAGKYWYNLINNKVCFFFFFWLWDYFCTKSNNH